MKEDEARQELGQDLLPGWSALVVMLTIFGALSVITVMTLLSGEDDAIDPEAHGRIAYGPADFPEIDFEMKLQPEVEASAGRAGTGEFTVPPPPFSDEYIFPCSDCHADLDINTERRELDMHDEVVLNHGPPERWCLDCHNTDDRDYLRLVDGTSVPFEESYKLCGQCHGTIYRDWRAGIHGRRRGYWDGAKEYLLCAHCHNPHDPEYQPIAPMPPPVRPQYLTRASRPGSEEPEAGGSQEK
ncbi:MAG: hypothetical protein OEV00_07740 [Acidobacteriota bacterium]|nr:hypothetical protein [Acidobacteriota bacterium]MDH3785206.1 hypothetical protein [Acidobacteriota bacterium]